MVLIFCLDVSQKIEIDFMSNILNRRFMQSLKGEVIIVHLTNKFMNASNVQGLFEAVLGTVKTHFRTILILPGKLDLLFCFSQSRMRKISFFKLVFIFRPTITSQY